MTLRKLELLYYMYCNQVGMACDFILKHTLIMSSGSTQLSLVHSTDNMLIAYSSGDKSKVLY